MHCRQTDRYTATCKTEIHTKETSCMQHPDLQWTKAGFVIKEEYLEVTQNANFTAIKIY
jgi:hypothetical protein